MSSGLLVVFLRFPAGFHPEHPRGGVGKVFPSAPRTPGVSTPCVVGVAVALHVVPPAPPPHGGGAGWRNRKHCRTPPVRCSGRGWVGKPTVNRPGPSGPKNSHTKTLTHILAVLKTVLYFALVPPRGRDSPARSRGGSGLSVPFGPAPARPWFRWSRAPKWPPSWLRHHFVSWTQIEISEAILAQVLTSSSGASDTVRSAAWRSGLLPPLNMMVHRR